MRSRWKEGAETRERTTERGKKERRSNPSATNVRVETHDHSCSRANDRVSSEVAHQEASRPHVVRDIERGDTWSSRTRLQHSLPTQRVTSQAQSYSERRQRGREKRSVPVSQTRVSSPTDMAAVVPSVVHQRSHLARQSNRRRGITDSESSEQVSSGIRDFS